MENDLVRTLEIVVAGFVGGFAGIIIDIYKKTMNDLGFSLFIFSLLIFLVILVYIILKIFKNSENISIKIKDLIKIDNKRKNNKSWFNRNKDNIEIIAQFGAIISVIVAVFSLSFSYESFNKQLEIQKELEFDEHLSNIRSLELELAKDFNLTRDLNNKIKTDDGKKQAYFAKLITENLQRSVIDGKISNEYGKKHLIYTLFYDIELNNVLESVSSSNVNISVRMKIYEQLSRDIEDNYINTLYNTYGWICEYMTCLEGRNKSIEYCNRDNETKQTIYCLQPKISFE